MSLLDQARADLQSITESTTDFGVGVTVTDPAGNSAAVTGLSQDIHVALDPDSGMLVSGRTVSLVLSLATLAAAGLGVPVAVPDVAGKPWLVTIAGATFKIREARPDRSVNAVVCLLDFYAT